ncbi:GNAT family N-acetyltransferase, partial [Brachybacterium paraconglomeratum]|nr:GNAT family N-acetyltransferase [Brachybacterium paraconglomeratum]
GRPRHLSRHRRAQTTTRSYPLNCKEPNITTLDAWTREDEPALAWYRARGFVESEHYLHVYKGWEDSSEGWMSPAQLSAPITAFCHAALEDEADIRARFSRVYVCRRFSQSFT